MARDMELVPLEQVEEGEYITDELQGDTTNVDEQDWRKAVTPPVRGRIGVKQYDGSPAEIVEAAVWRLTEGGVPVVDER